MGVLVGSMVACGGCDDGPSLATLSRGDVVGMPAGNAIGATVSGWYTTVAGSYDACRCRVGRCSFIHATVGEMLLLTQQDGVLTMLPYGDDFEFAGGINQDGEFWFGGAGEQPGLIQNSRAHGRVMLANGQPLGFQATVESTVIASAAVADIDLDCDTLASMTADFVGR